jgi:hypothetical protein
VNDIALEHLCSTLLVLPLSVRHRTRDNFRRWPGITLVATLGGLVATVTGSAIFVRYLVNGLVDEYKAKPHQTGMLFSKDLRSQEVSLRDVHLPR